MNKKHVRWNTRIILLTAICINLIFLTLGVYGATIDDIEIIPMVTLEQIDGHSANVAVDPTNNRPHVIWVKDGDMKHVYLKDNGTWSSAEILEDGTRVVFGGDEHDYPIRNVGMRFDETGKMHIVYCVANGRIFYQYWFNGSWSGSTLVTNSTFSKVHLDIAKHGDKLYVIYEDGAGDMLYYVVHDGSAWGTPVSLGEGEYCYLYPSDSGYLYYLARGKYDPRNVIFGYMAPTASAWTFVEGVSAAVKHLGAGPNITAANGNLYVSWCDKTIAAWDGTFKETAMYCSSAPEPGLTWNTQVGGDTVMYTNTSSPYMRVSAFSDGTVMYFNSRRANEQIKVLSGGVWSDSLAAPWDNGIAEVAQAGMTAWVTLTGFNYGQITVTGIKNNGQTHVQPPTISAAAKVNTTNLKLTFSEIAGASAYNIYRGTSPDFTPDLQNGTNRIAAAVTDEDGGFPGIQWTDTDDVVGNASINYFYAVTALNGSESDPSEVYGEFDFALVTTATTDFNEIALPLGMSNMNDADDLLNAIPNCTSVARWDASIQGYYQYIPGLSSTNFDVETGYPYYVNVSANDMFTLTGTVSSPTFSLVTTATTDFNDIMLPFDKSGITSASALLADISGCTSVAWWDATIQGYYQYIPGLSSTNFNTKPGYPYYVNVTSNIDWPAGSTLKQKPYSTESNGRPSLHVPHMAFGNVPEQLSVASVKAWISGRPDDVLTTSSPGCLLKDDQFALQLSSFNNGWKIGDELQLEFKKQDGSVLASGAVVLTDQAFDKVEKIENAVTGIPETFMLSQNYPNPFNPETVIQYSVPEASQVSLIIYNTMGQRIRTIVDDFKSAGQYQVVWNGKNDSGLNVPSGTYFYVMESQNFKKQMKAVLLR